MKVEKFNISKPRKYTVKGIEKTQWNNIGTITFFNKDDGSVSRIIEIPAIGLEANIFPFENKVEKPRDVSKLEPSDVPTEEEMPNFGEDTINPDEIPF